VPQPPSPRRITAAVALRLKTERLRQQISMTQMGLRSGLSQQMISYVERGMRNPTLDTLLRIAYVLQVDLWRVIKMATEQSRKQ
jgi:transcriptional regulator with XRE-family HTH domain